MRQREEQEIEIPGREGGGIGLGEDQAPVEPAHGGDHLRQRLAGVGARGDRGQPRLRVTEQDLDQDFA